ncbi:SMI1/KNR4 family protein [Streptomyces sp. NPDC018029]|uniref:SMI1/KNR4 family protein n=1 Tax=Streptomyces sp. NPDC018029 TaxID=3365032 RepID=UPI00379487D4
MTPALSRLTQLLPMPTTTSPAPTWDTAETALGAALPADYRELVEAYGGGFVDGYLLLLEPGCANDVYDLLKVSAEREEANASLWQFEDRPSEMEADGNRLVCWGTTDNGEYLYWLVEPGDDPDSRAVMVNSASGEEWERYDMTVTRFLVAVLGGEVRSHILWDEFPRATHEFRAATEMGA